MRFIWISALKDLRMLRREPFGILTWVAIPLCIGLLIRLIFGQGEAKPQGLLLIADQDNTIASRALTGAFGEPALNKMITVETVNAAAGRARIDRGDGSALLLIPAGLQNAYLNGRPFHLQLITNAGQRILPKIIEETLSQMVEGAFYLQRIARSELRNLNTGGEQTDEQVARNAVESNRLAREVSKYLNPPLIQLQTTLIAQPNSKAGSGDFFFPNMIFLSLLLMANGLSTDIWREHTWGTIRRLAVSPASLAAFLAGRVLTVGMVYGIVGLVTVAVAKYMADATVVNLAAGAAWAAASGLVFYLLLLPMAVTASGQRGADVRGNLLVFPLAMVGGCFFPFEVLPDWLARIGRWTPNGMAVTQFRDVLRGTVTLSHLAGVTAVLAVAALLAFYATLHRLRRSVAE